MSDVLVADEVSHLFHPKLLLRELQDLGKRPPVHHKADEKELQSLSKWAELHSVLTFEMTATPLLVSKGQVVEVHFHVKADYLQDCVNTGETLDKHYEEEFDVTYMSSKLYKQQEEDYYRDLSQGTVSDLDFEEIIGDEIDLGDVAAQYFLSSIDRHPKSQMMDLDEINAKYGGVGEEPHPDQKENPFDVLKELK